MTQRRFAFDSVRFHSAIVRAAKGKGIGNLRDLAKVVGVNASTVCRMKKLGRVPCAEIVLGLCAWAGLNPMDYMIEESDVRLVDLVTVMVKQRGVPTSAEDLFPLLNGEGYTRQQVIKALQNASYTQRLAYTKASRKGLPQGTTLCGYYQRLEGDMSPAEPRKVNRARKTEATEAPMPARVIGVRVASVWDYAQGRAA